MGIVIFMVNDVASSSPISDGGSHYVTGLLAYDWLHARELSNPLQFGTEYFKHLPYIGILLWPPLFYGLELVAFTAFGPSIPVALMLCSAIFVVGAVVLGQAVCKSGKCDIVAYCVAAAIITTPLIQEVQRNVLIDGLVAVLSLAAIFQFAYFFVNPSWRGALLSGLLTVLAFYAKGNAMQLGLAVPILALILRRPRMLIDRRTLALAAACILITGPWLYLTAGLSAQGFLYSLSVKAQLVLVGAHLHNIFLAMPVLAPFALVGVLKTLANAVKPRLETRPEDVFDAACFSIVVACILFHTFIPAGADARYMLTAIFAGFGLAVSGICTLLDWIKARSSLASGAVRSNSMVIVGILGLQAIMNLLSPLEAAPTGAGTAAMLVMKELPQINRSVLVAGDFNVETSVGPALAELEGMRRASKDGLVVIRGSRLFAGGAYRNRDYIAKFEDDAAYREELNRLGVPVIVTVTPKENEPWAHIAAIERVLAGAGSNYVKVAVVPFFRAQQMSVWRRENGLVKPVDFDLVTESNTFRERVNKVVP